MKFSSQNKIFFLLGLLFISGVIFSSVSNQSKPINENKEASIDSNYLSNKNAEKITCEDNSKNEEELAMLLENNLNEVNCIFGGCNSFF